MAGKTVIELFVTQDFEFETRKYERHLWRTNNQPHRDMDRPCAMIGTYFLIWCDHGLNIKTMKNGILTVIRSI